MFAFLDNKPIRTLRVWQLYLNIGIFACAFVAIGLAFAAQGILARLLLLPMALLFGAAVVLARRVYTINKRRRADVLAENAVDPELRALLDAPPPPDSPAAQLNATRPATTGRWGNTEGSHHRDTETQRKKKA